MKSKFTSDSGLKTAPAFDTPDETLLKKIPLDLVPPIAVTMCGILLLILAVNYFLVSQQKKKPHGVTGNWFPTANNLTKRQFEVFALQYTGVWIGVFCVVIVFQLYEQFDEWGYMYLCAGLDLPYLLQPVLFPLPAESPLPLALRYSFKANVWIAIFAFVGSYWYTHYFYAVLGAKYTFSSHRLNDVPIALYFAAHFYFVTYHTLSNLLLRKIETSFMPGRLRSLLFWSTVVGFSYFTAFMETLTISSFPDYSFEDRNMAYSIGSAFYGIYFLVSFPTFYRLDEEVTLSSPPYSLYRTVMEAAGASMLVLSALDVCRLAINVPLTIPGTAYYVYKKVY